MLQFITDNKCSRNISEQIKDVLNAGCRWIEINTEGLSDDEIKSIVKEVMPACLELEAFLIIRDNVELAKEINVGGVILRQNAEFPSHARARLGAAAVLGVEVSSIPQIDALRGLDLDFVMLSPQTTANGSIERNLPLEKVSEICRYMESNQIEFAKVAGFDIPHDLIVSYIDAGCNAVAMSESLARATDIKSETNKSLALLKELEAKEQAHFQ